MAQPFYARKTTLKIGPRMGQTVYSAQATYNGTITSKQIAQQISQESALTQADVLAVMERISHYCQAHMALGYKIHLEGLGVLYNKLETSGSVSTPKEVTAKLIKSIRPGFSPEYTIINGSFRYSLMPERTDLVKVKSRMSDTTSPDDGTDNTTPDETPSDGGSDSGSGTDNTGGSGTDDSGNGSNDSDNTDTPPFS